MSETRIHTSLTRDDCIRDTEDVPLPRLTGAVGEKEFASPGDWVEFRPFQDVGPIAKGRVIGRVKCEGKVYIELAYLCRNMVHIHWAKPDDIYHCTGIERIRTSLNWLANADFSDTSKVLTDLEYGVGLPREGVRQYETATLPAPTMAAWYGANDRRNPDLPK